MNVYVASGRHAVRLRRFSKADIEAGSPTPIIRCTFPAPKVKKTKKKQTDEDNEDREGDEATIPPPKKKRAPKGVAKQSKKVTDKEKDTALGSDEEEHDNDVPDFDHGEDDAGMFGGEESAMDGILPSSDPPEASWAVTQPARKKSSTQTTSRRVLREDVVDISD